MIDENSSEGNLEDLLQIDTEPNDSFNENSIFGLQTVNKLLSPSNKSWKPSID